MWTADACEICGADRADWVLHYRGGPSYWALCSLDCVIRWIDQTYGLPERRAGEEGA